MDLLNSNDVYCKFRGENWFRIRLLERAAVDGDSYVTFICASTHEQWCWKLQTLVSPAMPRYAYVEKVHKWRRGGYMSWKATASIFQMRLHLVAVLCALVNLTDLVKGQ